jgi:CRISPR-associated protein Cas1
MFGPIGPASLTVPARMLNEFCYCPRLGYLEWVQGEWAANPDTLDGLFVHRVVDKEDKKPVPVPKANDQDDDPDEKREEYHFHTRSLRLEDDALGLVAVVDLVEVDGESVTPVDYKKGKAPDIIEGAWEPDRVQLCAAGLLLRNSGFSCDEGIIYYAGSKTKVVIEFNSSLIERTQELLLDFQETAAKGQIPPPLVDSPKCPRCSLAPLCLPDETNLLHLGVPTFDSPKPPAIRQLIAPKDDARPLYVIEQGSQVGKSADRLTISLKGQKLAECRFADTSHLCLFGSIMLTSQAISELTDREIPVCHFSQNGWFRGITTGIGHKNVELRIRQFAAAADPAKATAIARQFVSGKIRNQRTMLRRNGDDVDSILDELNQSTERAGRAADIPELMGIEGMAAKRYFAGFTKMLRAESGFTFDERNRRPPKDPINAMLSFAYSLLTKECTIAAMAAGFDPMLGFLHAPRYGRPSLGLDLCEEFRPLLADSIVITLANTGEIKPQHFVMRALGCALTPAGRRTLLAAWERRLEAEITHPIFGYVVCYRRALQMQARLLARYLLGEIAEYPAFRTR